MSNTLRNTHQPDPQSLTEALSPTLKAEGYERRPIEERAMEIAKQTGAVHVEDLTKEGYPLHESAQLADGSFPGLEEQKSGQ